MKNIEWKEREHYLIKKKKRKKKRRILDRGKVHSLLIIRQNKNFEIARKNRKQKKWAYTLLALIQIILIVKYHLLNISSTNQKQNIILSVFFYSPTIDK